MPFVQEAFQWIGDNEALFTVMVAVSIVVFLGTLLVVPWMLVRLPANYFRRQRKQRVPMRFQHPAVRLVLLVGKNLLGGFFVVMGVAMLVLPGQGLLTILIGLILLDFPGKFRVQRYLVTRRPVWRGINWLRERAGRPRLRLD